MSAWTDFRDRVIDSLHFDEVTEEMKQEFTGWLIETVLPLAKPAADSFTAPTKEQAKNESGWCKVRDLIVLPAIINIGLWLTEKALTKANV